MTATVKMKISDDENSDEDLKVINDEQDVDLNDSQSEESNLVDDDDDDNDIVVFQKTRRGRHGVMLCYEKNRMSSLAKR